MGEAIATSGQFGWDSAFKNTYKKLLVKNNAHKKTSGFVTPCTIAEVIECSVFQQLPSD